MALDSTNVANDFENDTREHGKVEGKCATCESIGCKEADEGDGKECQEGCVGRQRNAVVIVGRRDGTGLDGAVRKLVCMGPVRARSEHHGGLNE